MTSMAISPGRRLAAPSSSMASASTVSAATSLTILKVTAGPSPRPAPPCGKDPAHPVIMEAGPEASGAGGQGRADDAQSVARGGLQPPLDVLAERRLVGPGQPPFPRRPPDLVVEI